MKTKLFENSEQLIMININNYNLKIIIAIEFRDHSANQVNKNFKSFQNGNSCRNVEKVI